MLSIAPIANAEYYLNLACEDYYLSGGEPNGLWLGSGATALGIHGTVEKRVLRDLLQGFSPQGVPLIQNAGHIRHQAGWDLTFSAPKSVSVAWAVANEATRHEIQAAHLKAVKAAIEYLERNAAFTRRGQGGTERESTGLTVAAFEHSTSRAQDPQLHSHCLVMNLALRADGTSGTIVSRTIYQHKMTAGALYRAELAARLSEMGFATKSQGTLFELQGVPGALLKHFSKRREVIEAALESYGATTAKAAETAARITRDSKVEVPRAELLARWKQEAATFGFTPAMLEALRAKKTPKPQAPDRLVDIAIEEICSQQSHFAKHEVVARVAEKAPDFALDARKIEAAVENTLAASPEVVRLGNVAHEEHYTSKALLATEASMLQTVKDLHAKPGPQVKAAIVEKVLEARPTLSSEQVAAARHLLLADGSVKVVDGMPGTGKTTMLNACREAWQAQGLRVVGCSLSAKAARQLREGSAIESFTVAKLIHEWDKTWVDEAKHHARQLLRAARGKRTYRSEDFSIDARTVLVVDEAGMVDTLQMQRLSLEVQKSGATLILAGDRRQLPPLGPGGAFQAIAREVGCAQLSDMKRQRNDRDIEALRMIADGDASSALESFQLREMLTVSDSKQTAIQTLVSDWKAVGLSHPEETAILTATNREATEINRLCQAARRETAGGSNILSVQVGEERVGTGDRVQFLQNHRGLGVLNGDLGTIIRTDPFAKVLTVKLDTADQKEKFVRIPIREYDQLQLGYARTTHKEQGATVERAFVLLGGNLQNQEATLVQASRHREQVWFYTDRSSAGDDLEKLTRQMESTSAKEMAHDILRAQSNPIQEEAIERSESVESVLPVDSEIQHSRSPQGTALRTEHAMTDSEQPQVEVTTTRDEKDALPDRKESAAMEIDRVPSTQNIFQSRAMISETNLEQAGAETFVPDQMAVDFLPRRDTPVTTKVVTHEVLRPRSNPNQTEATERNPHSDSTDSAASSPVQRPPLPQDTTRAAHHAMADAAQTEIEVTPPPVEKDRSTARVKPGTMEMEETSTDIPHDKPNKKPGPAGSLAAKVEILREALIKLEFPEKNAVESEPTPLPPIERER